MVPVEDLRQILGDPVWPGGGDLAFAEAELNVTLPAEYKLFAGYYGDAMLDEFIFFAGPRTLMKWANGIGRDLERSESVPGSVLPTHGGMLLWSNTVEGDQIFLVPHDSEPWTVSAWLRQRATWYESDLPLIEWLSLALNNETSPNWLPRWGVTRSWET